MTRNHTHTRRIPSAFSHTNVCLRRGHWPLETKLRAFSAILTLVLAGGVTIGCTPLYVAPAAHAPLFTKSGEFHVSGQLGTSTDGQVAIAVADQVGLVASVSFASSESAFLDEEYRNERRYGEVGGGWFRPVNGIGRVEILGGIGYGSAEVKSNGSTEDSTHYVRPFLQANLGLANAYSEFAFVSRLAYVGYSYDVRDMRLSTETGSEVFVEPTVVGRIGGRRIKAELQFGLILPIGANEHPFEPVHLSIGIHGVFGGSNGKHATSQ